MIIWILIILGFTLCASDPAYECGPHGKFEYCIDGIPGCVIGCHCHPGYYFDTDTKICEPNIKLSHDYRRHYIPYEPTRVPKRMPVTQTTPAEDLTTKDAVDAKVDEITNDADDLGDWLYNQFFKTIENQVMNKTTSDNNILTRRTGMQIKKPVRRSHKHMHGRKLKKSKKKNIKSKLLRITEDDSLFESDSDSRDDEDDDTSKSNDSNTSDEDTTDDDDDYKHHHKGKGKDKDHGHKKILIYHKKPRPQLPSFIFLPNMETPFFPPIGLPPPPVPMYPMIPVPPVMGPMFPFPGQMMPPNGPMFPPNYNTSSPSTVPTDGTTVPTPSTSAPYSEVPEPPPTIAPEDNVPVETQSEVAPPPEGETVPTTALRMRPRMRPKARSGSRVVVPINARPNKSKLLQKLRQKMMKQNKLKNFIDEQQIELDSPLMDANIQADFIPSSDPMKVSMQRPQPNPQVDFKYLTQLIHKMDPNGTARDTLVNALSENQAPIPSRRKYVEKQTRLSPYPFPNLITRNNTGGHRYRTDDSYYADLGKQIAAMIKNIDMTDNHHIDVEIEPNQITPMHPVINENTYGARSYWERSVRSPLKYVGPYKEHSFSEEHLFDLENEVESAASTVRNLNLQELESIISDMNKPRVPQREAPPANFHSFYKEPSIINLDYNELLNNNDSKLMKDEGLMVTTEVPGNIWMRASSKPNSNSMLLDDVFLLSNFHKKTQQTTTPFDYLPYIVKPTKPPNAFPVASNTFDQRRYNVGQSKYNIEKPIYNPELQRYNLEQEKYNAEQPKYNAEHQKYNAEQQKYNAEQQKYNAEHQIYKAEQQNYKAEQPIYNSEQIKYTPDQLNSHNITYYNQQIARYQNYDGTYNFPVSNTNSKFSANMFANSFQNAANISNSIYNPKPPPYIPPSNIYYYSTNNNKNFVFEKPTLPIHLQSLTRKIKPLLQKFEPYSYFQHFGGDNDF